MRTILLRLFLICCIFLVLISCKQNTTLKQASLPDKHKVDALINTGDQYVNAHLDSLLYVARKLGDAAVATGDKRALVYSEMFYAQYYWMMANHKKSMEIAVKCLSDASKWNITSANPAIYDIISNLNKENTNYGLAFDADTKGLNWAIANKDTAEIIALLGLKAMLIHTRREALHIALNDTSINLQFTGLKLAGSNPKYEQLRIPFYDNIAQYYLDNKNYKNAVNYGNKGVSLALKYNRQRSLTYSYVWLGYAWYDMGYTKKGISYLYKALAIAHDIKQPYREMEIYSNLYDLYYESGDYKKAIDLNRKAQTMRDSLQVHVNEKQISELQIKYETAKKDKEIALMGHAETVKNRQMLIILIGSVLIIVFFIILFLQYRIIRRNHSLISISHEKKEQALVDIAYIQSHELRKPLASILGLINVIKTMDGNIDRECLVKLEEASRELDDKIHDVLSHINEAK